MPKHLRTLGLLVTMGWLASAVAVGGCGQEADATSIAMADLSALAGSSLPNDFSFSN